MRTHTTPNHNVDDHPAGQMVLSTRRNVGARVNALAGYRVGTMFALSNKITALHADGLGGYGATN
ncbi:hypothetical protein [Kibdelosporangium aridum]|uniref:Uncharacterized protein n=1 Tax=Kibdelosporangium aridum TaxID=2030 RepID=A0A1Y5Y5V0_KIBAR|nr:hypothetical protein [Kibdelosporangium aridum]SMD26107.1 hypothetical protein SAMN05661093_09687 [Kibdelosporangium aridum]